MIDLAPDGDRHAGAADKHAPGQAWTAVVDWIYKHGKAAGLRSARQHSVLVAIARHCTDADGTGAHPSYTRLADMVGAHSSTVSDAVDALEELGFLVVERPLVTGRGRYNRYVVTMGRDIEACRRLLAGRHRAAAATEQHDHHPPEQKKGRPRRSFPSPGSSGETRENVGRTSGPGPDGSRSRRTEGRASAARSSPARAPALDSRLDPLRAELDGVDVSWQMTDEQAAAVVALLEVHGPRPLAAVALDLMTDRGRPTFARAWLGEWRKLPVPGGSVRASDVPSPRVDAGWCGSCDSATFRFVVDDDGLPQHPCPRCHPTARQAAPF